MSPFLHLNGHSSSPKIILRSPFSLELSLECFLQKLKIIQFILFVESRSIVGCKFVSPATSFPSQSESRHRLDNLKLSELALLCLLWSKLAKTKLKLERAHFWAWAELKYLLSWARMSLGLCKVTSIVIQARDFHLWELQSVRSSLLSFSKKYDSSNLKPTNYLLRAGSLSPSPCSFHI